MSIRLITCYETFFAISYVNSSVPLSTTLLKRECICETMNPGPFLIIRNTFPITFIALLFSEIIKTENTKTLYILHSSSKTQKYIPYHCYHYCHHPCILYLSPLHIYLPFCICYLFIYLDIILTLCA